jgi:hypothetical protein
VVGEEQNAVMFYSPDGGVVLGQMIRREGDIRVRDGPHVYKLFEERPPELRGFSGWLRVFENEDTEERISTPLPEISDRYLSDLRRFFLEEARPHITEAKRVQQQERFEAYRRFMDPREGDEQGRRESKYLSSLVALMNQEEEPAIEETDLGQSWCSGPLKYTRDGDYFYTVLYVVEVIANSEPESVKTEFESVFDTLLNEIIPKSRHTAYIARNDDGAYLIGVMTGDDEIKAREITELLEAGGFEHQTFEGHLTIRSFFHQHLSKLYEERLTVHELEEELRLTQASIVVRTLAEDHGRFVAIPYSD